MIWQRRFLALAKHVSAWSKDPSTKVGAVLTRGKRVLGVGFNGFPAGVEDDPYVMDNRDLKLARTLHAELNAVLVCRDIELQGAEVYVTHPPCSQCAAVLIQVGIRHVIYPKPTAMFMARWEKEMAVAGQLFAEARVKLTQVEEPHEHDDD